MTVTEQVVADKPAIDPVTFEIIQNSLTAISDEMFAVMRKTAMSAIGITGFRSRAKVARRSTSMPR